MERAPVLTEGKVVGSEANCVASKSGVRHRLLSMNDHRNYVFQGLENSLVCLSLVSCT